MTTLFVYIDDDTKRRLEYEARSSGRTIEELAEAAIANAASNVRLPQFGDNTKQLPLT